MSTQTSTVVTGSDHDAARRAVIPTAVVTFAVAACLSVTGANSTGEWIFEVGLDLVAAILLFGLVVPRGLRHGAAGGRGIVMAAIALLLVVPAFWLGLPLQLGAAAVILGWAGKRGAEGSGKSTAALVLGALAVVAYLAIYLGDYLSTHAG
jgi:hypothetical protein